MSYQGRGGRGGGTRGDNHRGDRVRGDGGRGNFGRGGATGGVGRGQGQYDDRNNRGSRGQGRARGRGDGRGGGRGGGAGSGGLNLQAEFPGDNDVSLRFYRDKNLNGKVPPFDSEVEKLEKAYSNQSLTLGLQKLVAGKERLPQRPAFGTQGRKICVYANYFTISVASGIEFYVYHVKFAPKNKGSDIQEPSKKHGTGPKNRNRDEPTGKKLRRLMQLLMQRLQTGNNSPIFTDFKSAVVAPQALPIADPMDIPYQHDDEDQPRDGAPVFVANMALINTLGLDDLLAYLQMRASGQSDLQRDELVQQLNIMFGYTPQSDDGIVTIGQHKNFFADQSRVNTFARLHGAIALRGYFRSVRAATGRLLLNVNVSYGIFYPAEPLCLFFRELVGNPVRANPALNGVIRMLRVTVNHLPGKKNKSGVVKLRTKTIFGFARTSDSDVERGVKVTVNGANPTQVSFKILNAWKTVAEYFDETYPHIKIDPTLPVVNVGTSQRPVYLPSDVCHIVPGQQWRRKLSAQQTSSMIKFACHPPAVNARYLTQKSRQVLCLDSPLLANYGVKVGTSLITVPARILPPPSLRYANSKVMPVYEGGWNLKDTKFHTGGVVKVWDCLGVNLQPWIPFIDLQQACTNFHSFISGSGIRLQSAVRNIDILDGTDSRNFENQLNRLFTQRYNKSKSTEPAFVLVILSNKTDLYKMIKHLADTQYGVQTICVRRELFEDARPGRVAPVVANLSLKLNLKYKGVNHIIDPGQLGVIGQGKTMIVGIDVTHPSPGSSDNTPSVAGIVASIDNKLAQWPGDMRIQAGRKEMVEALEDLMAGRLTLWYQHNQRYPENILIYRDGVSEGQYRLVLETELPAIQAACKKLYPANSGHPRISIVVVGKRHHTRFYPTTDNNGEISRSNNCMPGTVVDRGVTEARNWDFFMQAHSCLQGTARPAHYYVIYDEIFRHPSSNLKTGAAIVDSLESITLNMSHLFGRATRAVSICPPAYYADLLCERARCYLSKWFDGISETGSAAAGGRAAPEQSAVNVHPLLRNSMFYI